MTGARVQLGYLSVLGTAGLLVFLALALTGCEKSTYDLLRAADKLSSQAPPNYVQSQKLLDEVIERTVGDTTPLGLNTRKEAFRMRGQNFRNMGLLSAAETDFRTLVSTIDPNDGFSLSFLSTILVERGDKRLDDNKKNDFDYAAEFAERALKVNPEDWSASLASGLSRLQRGRFRRDQVVDDIVLNASGGDIDILRARIVVATGLPSEDSRCVALSRDLERRLELRSTDVRSRVAHGVVSAREDILAGLDSLRKTLATATSDVTGDAALALLDALFELGQLNEAIVLSRVFARVPNFRQHPTILDVSSRVFEKAKLYEECATTIVEYVDKGTWPLGLPVRRRALRAAEATKNPDLIERVVKSIRKKLGRDAQSAILARALDYYDALVVALRGGKAEDVAKLMTAFASKLDPELADIIPEAAIHGASAQRSLGSAKARELVDIGLATDPDNVALLKMRAQIELDGSADPLRAGKDIRKVIVQRPRDVEQFFSLLKTATEKFVSKTGRSLATIEEEASIQGRKIPSGFEEGWIYYVFARDYLDAGKFNEAANCALEAISRDSELKPAYVVLGLARARVKDAKEARQAFERAEDCIPDDPKICQEIAQTGYAPQSISLYLIAARAPVEGRLAVAESMLERGDLDAASRILAPLASQDDAPDSARILAARLLVTRDDPAYEALLEKVKPGSVAAVHANQVRLEAALKKGDVEAVKLNADRLQGHLTDLQFDRLAAAIRSARLHGQTQALEPAARLLVAATPASGKRDALELLGRALLDAGSPKGAVEIFDRLVGMTMVPEQCVWLALALDRAGDRAGIAEALTMIRRDWGGSPLEYQRAILALLAGVEALPEELASIRIGLDNPFSVVAAAAIFVLQSGRAPSPDELPRMTPWVDAAVEFAGASQQRAQLVLRTALCLRTPGGAMEGISELRRLDPADAAKPFVKYLWAEAYAGIPERQTDALRLFLEAATGLPDLDVAWSRGLDLTLARGDMTSANAIARAWAEARPRSEGAVLAARLASFRERLLQPDLASGAEKELTDLAIQRPKDFEVALGLLEARTATNRVSDAVASAKSLVKLCEESPEHIPRAVGPICSMFRKFLRDTLVDARTFGRVLASMAPNDFRPIELLVTCDLQEERFTDAGDLALEFLRKPGRLRKLTDADVSSFMSILLKTNPEEAGVIAQMSLGSVPGDLARWKTFTSTFEALNRDDHALRFLRPFVSIEPTGALRGMLAELLAKPGNDPAGALTLVAEAPAIQANRRGVVTLEHVAASRALALLGKSDEAVKILERALTDDAGSPVNLDNRTAWLALAFAYATRLEAGDAFKGANVLLRVSYAVGPESGARFQSMANLLRGLGRNMGPQHLMAAMREEEAAASRAASGPAASNPAESGPAASSPSSGDSGVR